MSIKIYSVSEQARGEFDGGKILENKPIPFIGEGGGGSKPYSNLFYWAHARSEQGGIIGIHPHKVFEIMSFVLKGSIEHYDTKNSKWLSLREGDVQIIRAGNGISHSEKMNPGSEMFQIWLDPDIQKTINIPASYNDYSSGSFPVTKDYSMRIKTYKGDNAPMTMETPGVTIKEYLFPGGEHFIQLDKEKIYSFYLIKGYIKIASSAGGKMEKNDFAIMKDEDMFGFTASEDGELFMIESPAELSYKTYSEMYR